MKKKTTIYDKYENKDTRCTYPFESDSLGYCWGYAECVDKGKHIEEKFCKQCELWKENE